MILLPRSLIFSLLDDLSFQFPEVIRLLQKCFGQFNPHPPSSAEFAGRPRKILPRKAQTKQDDIYFELLI